MYTLSNRPNKILTNTRRGITQKFDNLDAVNPIKKTGEPSSTTPTADMSSPRPVFYQVNGRRPPHYQKSPQEAITPQHEEIIKYIHDTWQNVRSELESSKPEDGKVPTVVYYQDKSTNSTPNFQPFDLETFWGQRVFQNITQST